MKKVMTFLVGTILSAAMLCGCNKLVLDTTYSYNYAYISLPNGECVEGAVQSWRDYEDGDQIHVTIDGVTYLTDTTRAVLVSK